MYKRKEFLLLSFWKFITEVCNFSSQKSLLFGKCYIQGGRRIFQCVYIFETRFFWKYLNMFYNFFLFFYIYGGFFLLWLFKKKNVNKIRTIQRLRIKSCAIVKAPNIF